jgi:hypothetical protein
VENDTKHKSMFGGLFGESCMRCAAGSGTETLYWEFLLMLDMVIGTFATNGTLSSWRRTFDRMDGGYLSREWHDRVG